MERSVHPSTAYDRRAGSPCRKAGRLTLPPVNLRGLRQSSKPHECDHLTHHRRGIQQANAEASPTLA